MDAFGWFEDRCGCARCRPQRSDQFFCDQLVDYASVGLLLAVERDELELDQGDYADRGSLPFDSEELSLAALLANLIWKAGAKFRAAWDATLTRVGFQTNALLDTVASFVPEMGKAYDGHEKEVRAIISKTLDVGEAQIAKGLIQNTPSRATVQAGIERATKFYTNEWFNRMIVPSIHRTIDDLMHNGQDAFSNPSIKPLRDLIDQEFKDVPYWKVVANAAASRGYHYGYLKAAQLNEMRGYKFSAVLDGRTSQLCRSLDGREFWIADAVNLLERVGQSDDPEAGKRMMPWLKPKDIEGLSNDQLVALGVIVPPLHGNCRSTIIAI